MNLAAYIATASALLSLSMAVFGWRVAQAPGRSGLRWFSAMALSAGAYAAGTLLISSDQSDALVRVATRWQLGAGLVLTFAALRVTDDLLGRRAAPLERWLFGGLPAGAALAQVPGLAYSDAITFHAYTPWHAVYRDIAPTRLGEALLAAAVLSSGVVLWRLLLAWRRGRPQAAHQLVAMSALAALGANDALASSGLISTPYLLDVGILLPVASLAWDHTNRFIDDARALFGLRDRLETLVEARTRELATAQAALHQAEKLASLGQFAAGVAHEVNNPAAVVTAHLGYLAEAAVEIDAPPETRESISEALAGMHRINALVRRLVDAGRLAAAPGDPGDCLVRPVAEQVLAEAQARTGPRVEHRLLIPDGLRAGLRPEVLHQILAPLLSNAGEAIPAGRRGRVEVAARGDEGRVRLTVRDDGEGMSPEVLRRAFEPFFTTRPEGQGTGLGLSVARALAESRGGELRLESAPDLGTCATVDLPEAASG